MSFVSFEVTFSQSGIDVQRRGQVRRAKLYYLRQRTGKATRIKEKVGVRKDAAQAKAAAAAKTEAKS